LPDRPFRIPLHRFPLVETQTPDAVREILVHDFRARGFDLRRPDGEFWGLANHLRLASLDLTFWTCSAAHEVVLPGMDIVKQRFALRGSSETVFGKTTRTITPMKSVVIPPGMETRYRNEAGLAEYMFRIKTSALRAKLGAMIGAPIATSVVFQEDASYDDAEQARLRRLLDHVVAELGETTDLPDQTLAQYEQSLMVCFLFASRHNYSHALEHGQPPPGLAQLRRAADYIEAHHSLPLTLEALAEVTGTGALAVSDAFRAARGLSPMAFLNRMRLTYARRMLLAPEEATTVAGVARRFGFANAASFARAYQRMYGEPPSATLADGRRRRS
jgi:AraC-like DNA-binding protein